MYKSYPQSNSENNPLISIIMPVYNEAKYIVGALDSIINQTYTNWELIVIDDCSTDNTFLVAQEYANRDSRIKVLKNLENLGVGKTLDKAVRLAQGDFIARMDGDDIAYPKRFEQQIAFLQNNSDVVAVGGQCKLIDADGNEIGTKNFPTDSKACYEMLYSAVPIQHPTLMVNKALLPSDFTWYDGWHTAQDLYLFFKLVHYGKLANISQYVLSYRYHRGGNSLKNPKKTFKTTTQIRYIGKTQYGYEPSLKGRIVNLAQLLIVSILPNFAIFWLYKVVRSLLNFNRMNSKQKLNYIAKEIKRVPEFAAKLVYKPAV